MSRSLHFDNATPLPVWLSRNLSLDGKLCLRDDKNAAFVGPISSPTLIVAGEHGKRHAMRANYMPHAVSDWLNPLWLGTIAAFGCKNVLRIQPKIELV